MLSVFFFFSSRRRHTIFDCDWSSDVCSSDLPAHWELVRAKQARREPEAAAGLRAKQRSVHNRSEEHTSELQSQSNLVCRLLLEKKKKLACDDRGPCVGNSARHVGILSSVGYR